MRIAIMQPYFLPYAGYFRLLSATDLLVLYDDVQFMKGGWIHRNELTKVNNGLGWCTLPVTYNSHQSLIKDMEWLPNADEEWNIRKERFQVYNEESSSYLRFFTYYLQNANGIMQHKKRSPLEFIIRSISAACYDLDIYTNVCLSSSLDIPKDLKGKDRVLWICKHFNANEYVNLPGGRDLYNTEDFKNNGVDLKFFCDYPDKRSILERLRFEKGKEIKGEINAYSCFY